MRPVVESLQTDVLILGAGGAGLCAALHAADRSPSLSVTIVVKGLLGRAGCTRMVQGGYNAVLTEPDSLDAHFLDTLAGGGWINDQELVWTLVVEAPGRVLELESRYGLEIPVLMIEGTKVAKYRVSEEELKRMLIARAGKAGGAGQAGGAG